ncbi:MAG: hypothetical protein ACI9XO_004692 [Paraglaciecola sp.]|jgi:hypothetical protein
MLFDIKLFWEFEGQKGFVKNFLSLKNTPGLPQAARNFLLK